MYFTFYHFYQFTHLTFFRFPGYKVFRIILETSTYQMFTHWFSLKTFQFGINPSYTKTRRMWSAGLSTRKTTLIVSKNDKIFIISFFKPLGTNPIKGQLIHQVKSHRFNFSAYIKNIIGERVIIKLCYRSPTISIRINDQLVTPKRITKTKSLFRKSHVRS